MKRCDFIKYLGGLALYSCSKQENLYFDDSIFKVNYDFPAQINLPNIDGYITLKCDFHTHTIFSDGLYWPKVRVDEALRDGLDVLAITDHIEYTPNHPYYPVDHNAAYNHIIDYAIEKDLLLVHGAEITRDMPPGHIAALFIDDASKLVADDVWKVIEEAINQKAFLQWCHPWWLKQQPDGIPVFYDLHRKMINNGFLHGIECYNTKEFCKHVLSLCDKEHLTVLGNSDVHGLITDSYHKRRPMTLVFAKEKSLESVKEALFEGRTLSYFDDSIVGNERLASNFFNNCISIDTYYEGDNSFFSVINSSDIPFVLEDINNKSESITVIANGVTKIKAPKSDNNEVFSYNVKNVITGENKVLKFSVTV